MFSLTFDLLGDAVFGVAGLRGVLHLPFPAGGGQGGAPEVHLHGDLCGHHRCGAMGPG